MPCLEHHSGQGGGYTSCRLARRCFRPLTRALAACALILVLGLTLSGCGSDLFLSSAQLERRVVQILEKPYSPHVAGVNDADDSALLSRYIEKAGEGSHRFEAYERLALILLNGRKYEELSATLEGMCREFITIPYADAAAVSRACELYLRYNPEGASRYIVWNRLVSLSAQGGDKSVAVQLLEAMAEEFGDDPAQLKDILLRQVELEEELRRFPDAVESWERLLALPGSNVEEISTWSTRLGRVFFLQRDFSSAEEVLAACAERTLPDIAGISCLLDLGTLYLSQEKLEDAGQTMRRILALPDLPDDLSSRAIFELADIEYQLGRYTEARSLFESIRTTYPNPMVIDMRLQLINQKLKR